jgi:hypothetical protein
MKNILNLDESERRRILYLHETATKKQYLSEQDPNANTADAQAVADASVDPNKETETKQNPINILNNDPKELLNYKVGSKGIEFKEKGTEVWQPLQNKRNIDILRLKIKDVMSKGQSPQNVTQSAATPTDQTQTTSQSDWKSIKITSNTDADVANMKKKINLACGTVYTDYENRLKTTEQQMAGKTLDQQKELTKVMRKDQKDVEKFCFQQYSKTNKLLPEEKPAYDKLRSVWIKMLNASWKVIAPQLTKLLNAGIEAGGDAGSKAVGDAAGKAVLNALKAKK